MQDESGEDVQRRLPFVPSPGPWFRSPAPFGRYRVIRDSLALAARLLTARKTDYGRRLAA